MGTDSKKNKIYYLANRERIKKYSKAYKQDNSEKIKVVAKLYRQSHPEKVKIRDKKYYLANREQILQHKREYYLDNIDKIRARGIEFRCVNKVKLKNYRLVNKVKGYERHKKWLRNNPDKLSGYSRKYYALRHGVNHVDYDEIYIYERDGWICGICGRKINKRLKHPNPLSRSIDHILPISRGGMDAPVNLQASHLRCNVIKNTQSGGQLRLMG